MAFTGIIDHDNYIEEYKDWAKEYSIIYGEKKDT